MSDSRLTVICHFRNEEVYLRYWLRHHVELFDDGVLIDYQSTDRSREVIRQFAPHWEVRASRNTAFHSVSIDAEVMDVERQITGWKMCLNVTEFILHHDLRGFVTEFERERPDALGLVTTGFIMQDTPEQAGMPLTDDDLWEQRRFGCPEPDPFHGVRDRRRLFHKAPHGAYGIGRHSNGVSGLTDPPLYLLWYGWCPLELKKRRNRSTAPMVPSCDWGSHHLLSDERLDDIWRTRYLPVCTDLFDGRYPLLCERVEEIRRSR
jgi:Glycosyl transferase family 2